MLKKRATFKYRLEFWPPNCLHFFKACCSLVNYLECRLFNCYAECHYAKCHYADCHGAFTPLPNTILKHVLLNILLHFFHIVEHTSESVNNASLYQTPTHGDTTFTISDIQYYDTELNGTIFFVTLIEQLALDTYAGK